MGIIVTNRCLEVILKKWGGFSPQRHEDTKVYFKGLMVLCLWKFREKEHRFEEFEKCSRIFCFDK